MEYTIIEVPDMNDSVSRVVLNGKQYQVRFTWNDTGGYWSFGLLDSLGTPIVVGMKIVPRFPINVFHAVELPIGIFGAFSELEKIGRLDFVEGKARFGFIPA